MRSPSGPVICPIADLAAAFCIEGRLVEDDGDLAAGQGLVDRLAVDDDGADSPSAVSVA